MARISLEIKVSLLLIITVIMIVSAGYLTYLNLSTIVNTLKLESTPDLRLLSLNELSSDLTDADNSVRLYMVTNEEEYLEPFYELIQTADDRMESLYRYNENMPYQLMMIDTIGQLVNEKLNIWDQMLLLENNNNVANAIEELSQKFLDEADNDSITDEDDQGFLKLFFKRKQEEAPPSIQKDELKEELSRLDQLRRIDSLSNLQLKIRESNLLEKNKELTSRLNYLISRIEKEENQSLAFEARQADALADSTFQWLVIFSMSIFFLMVLVFLVIINYVRKTNSTQKALKEAKTQAENLARTKEMFIANVSHEMRTPMNAIYGLSDQLLMRKDIENDVRNYLEVIGKSSNHLLSVINDILDFSKIHSGKIQLENISFKPRAIFDDVYQLNNYMANDKNIKLDFETDPSVPEVLSGDPVRLKQILLNIFSNAIKFTDSGSVKFFASGSQIKNNVCHVKMKIADTGIGIDKDRLEFIFEDFTQEEKSTTRKYGGTGLGLAIVKKLTALMGGRVEVKSKKNEGTIFTFYIPFTVGKPEDIPADDGVFGSIPTEFRGLKALIVDDEEYNRLVLRLILNKWNVVFQEVENGRLAYEKIKEDNFDIVLMDIRMPVMDGISATKMIREDTSVPSKVKIIGLSATNAKDDINACFAAGMDSFLLKPFNEKSLRKTFEYLVRSNNITERITANAAVGEKMNGVASIIEEPLMNSEIIEEDLDLQELYRLGSDDKQFVYELLKVFVDNSGKGIREMTFCLNKKDWKGIADTAHRISSACLHLKAFTLLALLKEIEKRSRDEDGLDKVPELISKAKDVREKFIIKVESHMEDIRKTF